MKIKIVIPYALFCLNLYTHKTNIRLLYIQRSHWRHVCEVCLVIESSHAANVNIFLRDCTTQ